VSTCVSLGELLFWLPQPFIFVCMHCYYRSMRYVAASQPASQPKQDPPASCHAQSCYLCGPDRFHLSFSQQEIKTVLPGPTEIDKAKTMWDIRTREMWAPLLWRSISPRIVRLVYSIAQLASLRLHPRRRTTSQGGR
jgi:hypothetical protein